MDVVSANGQTLVASGLKTPLSEPVREADLRSSQGDSLHIEPGNYPIGQAPMKFSLWALGGILVILGAAVLVRRPDLHVARMFAAFTGFAAAGLGVGPSSGGPAPVWALVVQSVTLVGVGAFGLPLAFSLAANMEGSSSRSFSYAFPLLGVPLIVAYMVSVLFASSLFEIVRPAVLIFVSVSLVGAVVFLAVKGFRLPRVLGRQQVRIALAGIGLGTLPFVILTLIPETVGLDSPVPAHLSVLFVGLIPAFFGYAILQHQLMGIRRLVHRGMVYGATTLALVLLIAVALALFLRLSGENVNTGVPLALLSAILVSGIVLFFPLQRGARQLVDRLIYRDVVDYQGFVKMVRAELMTSDSSQALATAVADRLAVTLDMESVLVSLGPEPAQVRLVARAGERAEWVHRTVYPHLQPYNRDPSDGDLWEFRWESDSFLVANLRVPDKYLGHLLLGPKKGGEVFVEEEKRLLAGTTPFLALALDKSLVLEELSQVNQRLMKAEEAERGRIAADLHDGPLQKALLLTRLTEDNEEEERDLARQLAFELREVCSRLRPAILDDLGLPSVLEWLLDGVSKRSPISTHLSFHAMSEEDRFFPEIEQALFRVAQEATNNVIKHSGATRLELSLSRQGETLVLQLADDGQGFELLSINRNTFGLAGMRERIIQLNGSLNIDSAPGSGTTVIARVPLDQTPSGER